MEPTVSLVVTFVTWGARIFRFLRLKGVVGLIRRKGSFDFSRTLHLQIGRALRLLLNEFVPGEEGRRATIKCLNEFATGARFLMCQLVEREDNEIHCCVKFLAENDAGAETVETVARSEPTDERSTHEDISHLVGANTIWSALLGRSDGEQTWRLFTCFSCNDLTKHAEFRCKRPDWQKFYKSTLVFPLVYPHRSKPGEFDIIGFLEFDSATVGAFRDLPDIFEHRTKPQVYHDILAKQTTYHFGAALADYLSLALQPLSQSMEKDNASSSKKRRLLENGKRQG